MLRAIVAGERSDQFGRLSSFCSEGRDGRPAAQGQLHSGQNAADDVEAGGAGKIGDHGVELKDFIWVSAFFASAVCGSQPL